MPKLNKGNLNGDGVTIRQAQITDLDKIYECETICFESPWSFSMLYEDIVVNTNTVYMVIEKDEQIIGYGGMWIIVDEAHITNVCVRPEFRGNGYAKQLMRSLAQKSHLYGAEAMTLEVRVSNRAALKLYKHCGFSIQGLRKKYYSNKEDAYIMWAEQSTMPI